jgi:hypothetical protein
VTIDVHIERLVLEGIDLRPPERERLRVAVEASLTSLLAAEPPSPLADRAAATIHAGAVDLEPRPDLGVLGGRLAAVLDTAIRVASS